MLYLFYHYGRDLPDYRQLADYEPPTVTRLHAGDGRLLVEYATEKRVYVPVKAIPLRVVNAFLAAEDKNFYSHPGVDFLSVVRAIVTNVANIARSRRPVGASTITQQVAKNFLLTNEVSITRKVKEAILAFRIEHAFDKDRILDLYLNEIYLGFGSYGVAAAALNYFNKSLDELTVAEAAFLAALPKAPNNYHPIRRHEAAVARRDWVIGRMLEDGRISFAEAETAWATPLEVHRVDPTEIVEADYFVELVRRELAGLYGDTNLYEGGLSVRTTLDPRLQRIADRVLREGLIAYDRRHGWRGPVDTQGEADFAAPQGAEPEGAAPEGAAPEGAADGGGLARGAGRRRAAQGRRALGLGGGNRPRQNQGRDRLRERRCRTHSDGRVELGPALARGSESWRQTEAAERGLEPGRCGAGRAGRGG